MLLIKRGDWILGDSKWTQVIGICHRSVSGGIGSRGHRYTSGTWIRQTDGTWTHPTESEDTTPWSGMNLLTESAVFSILLEPSSKKFLVRDFTEVGFDRLPETYARVEVAMTDPDVL